MTVGLTTSVIQRGKTGIARYVFSLVQALSQHAGHRLILFVLREDLPLFGFAQAYAEIIPVAEEFRPPAKDIFWHQYHLPQLARRHNVDLCHVPSYRRMVWSHALPNVATIHDLAPFHVKGKYDWKRMLYGRVIARQLAARQTRIIAISQNTARDVSRFFSVPSERISVIYNGIDHTRFRPPEAMRTNAISQPSPPFFLYVARLEHPGKNHLRLIEAFNRFKQKTGSDWQLAFAGSDWHGADVIHSAVKSSPYAADIRSLGFVADDDLPALYSAATVFVYPSLFEGFGLPPVEAMACGTPVICSARGALGEVVGKAALIVDPENVEQMSHALAETAANPGKRAEFTRAGLAQAAKFTWEACATQTVAVYEREFRGKA